MQSMKVIRRYISLTPENITFQTYSTAELHSKLHELEERPSKKIK